MTTLLVEIVNYFIACSPLQHLSKYKGHFKRRTYCWMGNRSYLSTFVHRCMMNIALDSIDLPMPFCLIYFCKWLLLVVWRYLEPTLTDLNHTLRSASFKRSTSNNNYHHHFSLQKFKVWQPFFELIMLQFHPFRLDAFS